jgi:hypothetical protein
MLCYVEAEVKERMPRLVAALGEWRTKGARPEGSRAEGRPRSRSFEMSVRPPRPPPDVVDGELLLFDLGCPEGWGQMSGVPSHDDAALPEALGVRCETALALSVVQIAAPNAVLATPAVCEGFGADAVDEAVHVSEAGTSDAAAERACDSLVGMLRARSSGNPSCDIQLIESAAPRLGGWLERAAADAEAQRYWALATHCAVAAAEVRAAGEAAVAVALRRRTARLVEQLERARMHGARLELAMLGVREQLATEAECHSIAIAIH